MQRKSWDRQVNELWQLAWIRTPVQEIAEELGRSEGAVRRKARALGIALGPRHGERDLDAWRAQPILEMAPVQTLAAPSTAPDRERTTPPRPILAAKPNRMIRNGDSRKVSNLKPSAQRAVAA